jgi:DNA-directed RNA polymerase subunit RPC12/RpoP
MHWSQFADQLSCKHCGKRNQTTQWPINGDSVAYYAQAESGSFSLKIRCPHCERDWYVVWDEYPGPIETLSV